MASVVEAVVGVTRWAKSSVGAGMNAVDSVLTSGAIDVVVVEQPDGTLMCTPFHVRVAIGFPAPLRRRSRACA